jgi:adenylate cyclase
MSRRLGDTRLSEVVGGFMRLAGQQLDKRGASAQKYIGDSVMGVWDHGPTRPGAEAILPVLLTAVKLFEIAGASEASFGADAKISIGAGINTGLAVLGNLGSRAAADYTALGDTVNKAFRLESASKEVEHDMLIGTLTWECLEPALQSRFHPCTVTLKGYDEPQPAYGMSIKSLAVGLDSLRQPQKTRPGPKPIS